MEIQTLHLFLDVAREGHFAGAARLHHMAPSSVSRMMGILEAELGFRLFQRTTRQLSLTEAGQAYHDQIVPLLCELRAAGERVRDFNTHPRGRIRVAASGAFVQTVLAPLMPELARNYPELEVEWVLSPTPHDLIADNLDLAVRIGVLEDSSLVVRKLRPMRRKVVVSPTLWSQHPVVAPEDLSNRPCLVFPHEGQADYWRFRGIKDSSFYTEVPVQGRFVVPDGVILRDLALSGLGYALLPDWLVVHPLSTGELRDVFPHLEATATDHHTWIYLLYPSRSYLPLKVRIFSDFLITHLGL